MSANFVGKEKLCPSLLETSARVMPRFEEFDLGSIINFLGKSNQTTNSSESIIVEDRKHLLDFDVPKRRSLISLISFPIFSNFAVPGQIFVQNLSLSFRNGLHVA